MKYLDCRNVSECCASGAACRSDDGISVVGRDRCKWIGVAVAKPVGEGARPVGVVANADDWAAAIAKSGDESAANESAMPGVSDRPTNHHGGHGLLCAFHKHSHLTHEGSIRKWRSKFRFRVILNMYIFKL